MCGSLHGMWVWIQVFGAAYVNVYEIMLNICVCACICCQYTVYTSIFAHAHVP